MGLQYPGTLRRSRKPPVAVCLLLRVFVMVCVGFGLSANGAGHCFNCEETIMDCDMDLNICRSRCEKKVPCESENSYCAVITWSSGNATDSGGGSTQLSAALNCYEIAVPLSESDITTHFCGTVDEEGYFPGHSCLCTHDYCNDAIYLPGSKHPEFPTSGGVGSTFKPTRPDLGKNTPSVKPSTKEVDDADGGVEKGINVAQLVGMAFIRLRRLFTESPATPAISTVVILLLNTCCLYVTIAACRFSSSMMLTPKMFLCCLNSKFFSTSMV